MNREETTGKKSQEKLKLHPRQKGLYFSLTLYVTIFFSTFPMLLFGENADFYS